MPTLTIRNVVAAVVRWFQALVRRRHFMGQEVRELLETYVAERRSVLYPIEGAFSRQTRRPTATEVDEWIAAGCP